MLSGRRLLRGTGSHSQRWRPVCWCFQRWPGPGAVAWLRLAAPLVHRGAHPGGCSRRCRKRQSTVHVGAFGGGDPATAWWLRWWPFAIPFFCNPSPIVIYSRPAWQGAQVLKVLMWCGFEPIYLFCFLGGSQKALNWPFSHGFDDWKSSTSFLPNIAG